MSYTRYDVPNESGNVLSGLSLYYDSMYIGNGGTATKTTLTGGSMYVSSGGTATDTTLTYYVSMNVLSSGEADNTVVNSYCQMYVIGGSADSTTINSDGYVTVGNGGLVNHTTITSGASMILYTSSGWEEQGIGATTASNTTVLSDGVLYLSSGAVADGINVAGSGRVYVYSGATATGIVAESGAGVQFPIALDNVVTGSSGGTEFALSDGKISDLKIDSGYGYGVESGATATNPVV